MLETQATDVVAGEESLFYARRTMRQGRTAQLHERVTQLEQEIGGLEVQIVGKDREIQLIEAELGGARRLLAKGLTQLARVNGLEREAARLQSERGTLIAGIAQAKGRIAETQLQILEIRDEHQQAVATELREVETSIGEFSEGKEMGLGATGFRWVPHGGGAAKMRAILAGESQFDMLLPALIRQPVAEGTLRPVAVASEERLAEFPTLQPSRSSVSI